MRIAIFRKVMGPNWNLDPIIKETDVARDSVYTREYTQVTDWAEVEFTPLSNEHVIAGQLKQLDQAEQELRDKFAFKLSELAEARAKLLSLTHEVAP